MRRIYLESLTALCACFLVGLFAYDIAVYQLTTDYEFLLEDYEALGHQQMLQTIADSQGIEAAEMAMQSFANTTRHDLNLYADGYSVPKPVSDFFSLNPNQVIYYDDERDLWVKIQGSSTLYQYTPNEETLVRRKIELEDALIWVFFIGSFALYSVGHMLIIFRRVKKLEKATLNFAQGDLSARAETAGGEAIGTLNRSFNVMADRIHRLIESNRGLTNAVAHELRTPVFRIQWQAEMLKDTPLDKEQFETINSIVEDTEEMEKMVDELLYYAKLDNRQLELSCQAIPVEAFLREALKGWQKESPITLELRPVASQDIYLYADKKLVKRALDNLVRNAIKFADSKIMLNIDFDQQSLAISVHDDGPGVDETHFPKLFEPFYVGSKARNKAKSGHGLGLSIVSRICEQHGAVASVGHSDILTGAVFTMTFPVCNEVTDKAIQ
ncbi:Sensor histidine kinase [Vibrio sinaloensis DSM 21326]|uniref:histidine kinase n=1 Tax=Vibrio sinaloensis DSM 21326 TaxID=945550 RepID=E8M689_PHOS4|nr:ATP-binding protein [Vibrio sinaloensis]EGA70539.1 Sensor histidine kinase [Vibrio sinaloensis DSM 21326]